MGVVRAKRNKSMNNEPIQIRLSGSPTAWLQQQLQLQSLSTARTRRRKRVEAGQLELRPVTRFTPQGSGWGVK